MHFDNGAMLTACIRALADAPPIPKTRLQWSKADMAIAHSGVEATERATSASVELEESQIELPDILTELEERTKLTRRSLHRILVESQRLADFQRNPQNFIELATELINRTKRLALVDGIKYQRLGAEAYYAQELFESQELRGYLHSLVAATKSVHEQVIYQSDTERAFAEDLEKNEAIKLYAKLPAWFQVPTPLDPYNPDWAVLVDRPEGERLYLVVETKSSLFLDELRDRETGKISCGKAHFRALAEGDTTPHQRPQGKRTRLRAREPWHWCQTSLGKSGRRKRETSGRNGRRGRNGRSGRNGRRGRNGRSGRNGRNGRSGRSGRDGRSGKARLRTLPRSPSARGPAAAGSGEWRQPRGDQAGLLAPRQSPPPRSGRRRGGLPSP